MTKYHISFDYESIGYAEVIHQKISQGEALFGEITNVEVEAHFVPGWFTDMSNLGGGEGYDLTLQWFTTPPAAKHWKRVEVKYANE